MSRGKEFVFTVPVEGYEEITVFAETKEEALEKLINLEHSTSYVSETFWTEEPTVEDHLVAERGEG